MVTRDGDGTIALRAGLLIDGAGGAPVENPTVLIEGNHIAGVFAGGQYPSGAEIEPIDLGPDTVILPGLIDCHLHLIGDTVIPPHKWSSRSREELYQKATTHAEQALKAGVTTLRDCGAPDGVVIDLRDAIDAGAALGPHVLSCNRVVTTPGGHGHFMGIEVQGARDAAHAVEDLIADGADFIKVIASGGGGTPGTYPWDSQFSLDELKAIVRAAHRHGKRVGAHAHATIAMDHCIDAGVDTIEHTTFITPDGPRMDDALADKLARLSTMAIPTIACYRNPVEAGIPKTFIQKIGMEGLAYVALHQSHVRHMLDRGVKVAAGTDGVQVGVPPTAARDEARYMAEVAGSNMFGIQSATGLAAEALGIEADRGTIEVGKRADLLVVAGNPLNDMKALEDVVIVVKNGQIIR